MSMHAKTREEAGPTELGERIEAERNKRRMTKHELADAARCDVRTLYRAIKGKPVRSQTRRSICAVLNIDPETFARRVDVADDEHGGYTRHHYEACVGTFVAYRRSFTVANAIVKSAYRISWSDELNCLAFVEDQKFSSNQSEEANNYSQSGEVFISNAIGLLHFLTKFEGALRLVTLKRLDADSLRWGGVVLTQARGPYFHPSASPIYLRRADDSEFGLGAKIINASDPEFGEANTLLNEIDRDVASFAVGAKPITADGA